MIEILGHITNKVSAAIGGWLGGTTALRFMDAKTPKEAFFRGALSIVMSVIFGTPLLYLLDLPYQNWEWQLASGFVWGFIGYATMNAAANYIKKQEDKDLSEILSVHMPMQIIKKPRKTIRKNKRKK